MLEFQILFWLLTKHIIADYFTQYPWMYKYKGIYGHPGGLAHAGWHGLHFFLYFQAFLGGKDGGLLRTPAHTTQSPTELFANKHTCLHSGLKRADGGF